MDLDKIYTLIAYANTLNAFEPVDNKEDENISRRFFATCNKIEEELGISSSKED